MRTLTLIPVLLTLSACSAYESSGRKYLEKSAYDLSGLKLHERLVGCAAPLADASWRSTGDVDSRARVFERDTPIGFELRVEPADVRDGAYACDYVFPTAEDRRSARSRAVDATLNPHD